MLNNFNSEQNILIKLLNFKTKPDFSQHGLEQIKQMYLDFEKNKFEYLKEISNAQAETIFFLNNLLNCTNKINDFENKKNIVSWFENFWNNLPILNNSDGKVSLCICCICLEPLTNVNCTILNCSHTIHTDCFANYLFANLNALNNSNNLNNLNEINYTQNLTKLFKCPNCRKYITQTIEDASNQNEQNEQNDQNNFNNVSQFNNLENIHVINEHEDEDEYEYDNEYNNLILQEYNLVANSLDNQLLNNIFRTLNTHDIERTNNINHTNTNQDNNDEFDLSSNTTWSSLND